MAQVSIHFHCTELSSMNVLQNFSFCVSNHTGLELCEGELMIEEYLFLYHFCNILPQWDNMMWTFSLKWTLAPRPGVADVSVSENRSNPHSLLLSCLRLGSETMFLFSAAMQSGLVLQIDRRTAGTLIHCPRPQTEAHNRPGPPVP